MMFAGAMIGNVLLIALPVAMAVNDEHTYRAIAADRPELDAAAMDVVFYAVLAYTVVLHGLGVVFNTWFGLTSLRGRGWARIALTVYLAVAAAGGLFSAGMVPDLLWLVIVSDMIQLAMLYLLWVPKSVREHFAANRSRRRRPVVAEG